jgi:hypothetical protein
LRAQGLYDPGQPTTRQLLPASTSFVLALRALGAADKFLYDFKGALTRAGPGRSGLDKGTLAAAQIGLVRAGQRPPDRRTAYGPPPLVKPAAPSARSAGSRMVQAREAARR